MTDSRAVDWWSVHEFSSQWLDRLTAWPLAGTPAWCQLDDADPRKLAAVLDGGRRDALRNETRCLALAAASRAVCAATDWPTVARGIRRGRGAAYISRRTA